MTAATVTPAPMSPPTSPAPMSPAPMSPATTRSWAPVCAADDLLPERGVAALVGGEQVAVFRTHDGRFYALGNLDPFSGAYVLSRGIVGSHAEIPTVASPMYKQVFDLRTGHCLSDPGVSVPAYPVSCRDGTIRVGAAEPE